MSSSASTTATTTSRSKTTTTNQQPHHYLDRTGKWLLVFASATIFLYGGAFYGWGPMQLLLEENGHFADRCGDAANNGNTDVNINGEQQDEICDEQTAALLNVRFTSQLALFASPLMGIASDRYGATVMCLGMAVFCVTGIAALMVAASGSPSLDWMLYIAFFFMGLASTGYGMLTVNTGLVFGDKRLRSRVISGMNSLYDAGAVTYWGLWGIAELVDSATLTNLAGGYFVLGVVCLFGYWFLFRCKVAATNLSDMASSKKGGGEAIYSSVVTEVTNEEELQAFNPGTIDDYEESSTPSQKTTNEDEDYIKVSNGPFGGQAFKFDDKENDSEYVDDGSTENDKEVPSIPEKNHDGYIKIADRPFGEQMKSQSFIMLALFFSYHQMSNIWTLTTQRDFLGYLGDDEYNNRYLTIFTLLTPVSLLALPFVDVAIHKYGFHMALQGVNILAIAHGTIKVVSTNLNVQILGFVIFSFFRCFLFSVSLSCLPTFISHSSTGRALSILSCTSGALCFFNIPFANLALNQGGGNFFLPNLLYLLMTLPMILVAWVLGKGLERDGNADGGGITSQGVMKSSSLPPML